MNYLLLPGNPPAVHFYELWSQEIMRCRPESQARVSVYPTMVKASNSTAAMQNVLEAHLEQVRKFQKDTNKPVTLIGHSLGGYFSLKLLEEAEDLVEKVFLVHPFLQRPDPHARLILKAAGSLHTLSGFQQILIKNRKVLELFSKDLPHISNEEIVSAFHLGHHEFNTIAQEHNSIHIPEKLRSKVHAFYGLGDWWCGRSTVEQLKKQIKTTKCSEPHAFVTQKKHRDTLFAKIQHTI